ncbi:beta-ketoacyl-ACP synthase II [Oceanicaulis sp. AH-315-P02]|nr:beta-ketoacyl-ACP synthase II [Robiginitomaculum sp.]MBN4047862.1 beta-ketoacyl-ACP synthase II [Oceanicaulis sp. AH-315-P02]
MKRRVVITGLGLVTPLGASVASSWQHLIAGMSGAKKITHFETDDLACKIAAQIPWVDGKAGGGADVYGSFDPDKVMSKRDRKRVDNFILYGVAAADEAIADSGWTANSEEEQWRAGVMIGAGIGGLQTVYDASILLKERGPRKLSPFIVPSMLINLTSGQVSIKYGLKGPNHSVVTACSTGAHAIGDASAIIARGDADMMVAGGAESSVSRMGIASFVASRALTTGFNDTPTKASRPYDKDRDGFLMGEGSGVVVLEDYETARARGAKIYAEVSGYGMSGDAYHITAPAPDGSGAFRSMQMALKNAGLTPSEVDYVNAHGTSTPLGDEIELRAVERLFDEKTDGLVMSATKSSIGHLLGAAGAVETIFSVLAINNNICPPTLNLDNPSVETKINLAPHKAVEKSVKIALTNSFGFGGTNASLVLREVS